MPAVVPLKRPSAAGPQQDDGMAVLLLDVDHVTVVGVGPGHDAGETGRPRRRALAG